MFFYITIYAKEKTTLKFFLNFISKVNEFSFDFFSQKQKKNKHKFVTILKSPHINKTAQEQFEYKCFSNQMVLYLTDPFFSFVIFKRVLEKGFPGLKIKLSQSFNKKKQNKFLLIFLNPNNILLSNKPEKKKIKSYFLLFDSFGEISLQNFKTKKHAYYSHFGCIFSSVG